MNKLYTVKEIADILQVSKPTVQRAINMLEIEAEKEDNKHSRYYSYENTKKIVDRINPDFIILIEAQHIETTETFGATSQHIPKSEAQHTETPPKNDEIELIKTMVATLQEQINIKDKQIAEYQEQIKEYSKRLAEVSALANKQQELTERQQYITVVDKAERLAETQTKDNNEIVINTSENINNTASINEKKKSIWQRIFNK